MTHPLFQSHALNRGGIDRIDVIRHVFSESLERIEAQILRGHELGDGDPHGARRLLALVRTHLEEACMCAVKAVAVQKQNQEPPKAASAPPAADQCPSVGSQGRCGLMAGHDGDHIVRGRGWCAQWNDPLPPCPQAGS